MGTKMAVAFANIIMASIERQILRQSVHKPLTWKRFIDDVFCFWDTNKEEIEHFVEQANSYHPVKDYFLFLPFCLCYVLMLKIIFCFLNFKKNF